MFPREEEVDDELSLVDLLLPLELEPELEPELESESEFDLPDEEELLDHLDTILLPGPDLIALSQLMSPAPVSLDF